MLLARKIFFYLFVFIYLLLCPFLILYSLGYIFNPVNKQLSLTGLIHLSTVPAGANIYLAGSRYMYKTPASITELLPGNYPVFLKLKGYRLWKRWISVKSGESSAFENIMLVPEVMKPVKVPSETKYIDLLTIDGIDQFFVQNGRRLGDLYFFDRKNEKFIPVVWRQSPHYNLSLISILPQTKNMVFVACCGPFWQKRYLYIDLQNKEEPVRNITKLFSDKPLSLVWDTENQNNVFAVYKNHTDRLNLRSMSLYPKYLGGFKGFGASGKWMYVLGKDNAISMMTLHKKEGSVLFDGASLSPNLFDKSFFYEIRALENKVLLFRGDKGDLMASVPPYYISKDDILGMDFNKQNGRLLYWTKDTIWVAGFDPFKAEAVYKKGKHISQCFWAYNGTHIVFRDKNEVFLLELQPDGEHYIENIVRLNDDSACFYSEENDQLYYLDEQGDLMRLRIVPNVGIL